MATQTKGTVNDVLQIISDLRGETSVNTNADRIRAVSRANRDFALRSFWKTHLITDQTITASGTSTETIGSTSYPMRSKGLMELFVGGTTNEDRYDVIDYINFKRMVNAGSSEQFCYEWYDKANDAWKVTINPTPDSGDTIYYSYYWEPATLTATTDAVICPNLRAIALLALGDIYLGEDETQKALLVKQEAEQIISELEGLEEAPAENQSYAMGAIENISKMRGFGTY